MYTAKVTINHLENKGLPFGVVKTRVSQVEFRSESLSDLSDLVGQMMGAVTVSEDAMRSKGNADVTVEHVDWVR